MIVLLNGYVESILKRIRSILLLLKMVNKLNIQLKILVISMGMQINLFKDCNH